jgi:hypothetical protein
VTRATFAIAAAVALVAAACGGGGGDDKGASKTTTSSSAKPAAPPVAPLTGLPDPSGVAQTRPVLSVKVENTPEARPQSGLESADIVWDEVVEGQITRLLAMFQSRSTDVVGPIRSVRLTDPLIVWPVGGIFAFSGGAPTIVKAIEAAPVKLVVENSAGAAMFRDRSRRSPHNLFGHPDALFAFGGTPSPPPPLFRYLAARTAPSGTPATAATIAFRGAYAVGYTWDAASGTWLRTTAGRPFVSRTGSQIATQNVVILPVTYQGGVGNEGSEAQLIGQGSATVLSGGTVIQGTWVRPDKTKPMELRTADGKPIRLGPGSTWVELPDVSYPVNVVSPPPPSPTG